MRVARAVFGHNKIAIGIGHLDIDRRGSVVLFIARKVATTPAARMPLA